MRHEMLTQCALFCIAVMAERVMLSRHFMTACHTSSAVHVLTWCGLKGYAESAFHDTCHTSSAVTWCGLKGYAESAFHDTCHTSSAVTWCGLKVKFRLCNLQNIGGPHHTEQHYHWHS
jgi:hypothetical protein